MKSFKHLAVVTAVAIASQSSFAANSYKVIELGNLGQDPSFVYDINANNQATGYSRGPLVDTQDSDGNTVQVTEFDAHSFIFEGTTVTDLGAIENPNTLANLSFAFGMNNAGWVVGSTYREYEVPDSDPVSFSAVERAAIFEGSEVITEIPPLVEGTDLSMRALGINDNNIVVGFGKYNRANDVDSDGNATDDVSDNGFIYDHSTQMHTIIEPLSDDSRLNATMRDVNNAGIAVGWAQELEENIIRTRAIYVDPQNPGVAVPVMPFGEGAGFAWSINENGIMVGKAADATNSYFTAFMYDINTEEAVDLGVLNDVDGGRTAEAFDINNSNSIVGASIDSVFPTTSHAFIYENGEMKDLNDLIDCRQDGSAQVEPREWTLIEARAINDAGYIVGNGVHQGVAKAFMLEPSDDQPVACESLVDEDEDEGSGSLPLVSLLFAPLVFLRRRK